MGNGSETRLRGADLEGSEAVDSVDHTDPALRPKVDADLHLDGEKESLYEDSLDVEDDLTLAGTKANSNRG